MNIKDIIKIIENYPNPYPLDIFSPDNVSRLEFNRGIFNKFIHDIVENVRCDLIKLIKEKGEQE